MPLLLIFSLTSVTDVITLAANPLLGQQPLEIRGAMPRERTRPVATRFELYSTACVLCGLNLMVGLSVLDNPAEYPRIRFFVLFIVFTMQIWYVVVAFMSRREKS
jgi:hypothetical protein